MAKKKSLLSNALPKAAMTSIMYAAFYAIFSRIYYAMVDFKKVAVGAAVFFAVYYIILLYAENKVCKNKSAEN